MRYLAVILVVGVALVGCGSGNERESLAGGPGGGDGGSWWGHPLGKRIFTIPGSSA
jgi:hypothetical protein